MGAKSLESPTARRALFPTLFLLFLVMLAGPGRALGAPIIATFSGTVDATLGRSSLTTALLADIPFGTVVSFAVVFDDLLITDFDAHEAQGSTPVPTASFLTVGSRHYELDSYELGPPSVDWITHTLLAAQMLFYGSGPDAGGGPLFRMQVTLDRNLALVFDPLVGYDFRPDFAYVIAGGDQSFSTRSVPTPPASWLMASGLIVVWRRAFRRGRSIASIDRPTAE